MSRRSISVTLGAGVAALAVACSHGQQVDPARKGVSTMPLEVKSPAFVAGGTIPKKHTGDGPDVSPPLTWSATPAGTKSLALICDDPDAPRGTWVHWVLWGLPHETRELAENIAKTDTVLDRAKQGRNDFGDIGYGGPSPPPGKPHRYFFKLYALDCEVDLKPGATKADLESAMKGHILAQGELMGKYGR